MAIKIKVLHIIQSLETGGLENGIVNLVNRSNGDQFQVDVLCLRAKGELEQRITNKNSCIIVADNGDESIKGAIRKVLEVCRQGQYHIVHSHGWTTMLAGYVGAKLARIPVIMNGEHGTLYFDTWTRRLMQRFLFNRMDLNLTVSGALKNEIMQRFGVQGKNFKPIINGVDIDRFRPASEEEKCRTRKSLGLTEQHFIIGTVGRLVEVKNYPSLIRGFSIAANNRPDLRLILPGTAR